jgi:6-phosphofructokinase 1
VRKADDPYVWETGKAPLAEVANVEKFMPAEFITEDGFGITDACRKYLQPLIVGEDYPPYVGGLPDYVQLKNQAVEKRLDSGFTLAK